MDLEGAETFIIPEIGDKIKRIDYAVIDLHAAGTQSEKELENLIEKIKITHSVEIVEKDVHVSIPARWQEWLIAKRPIMKVLYAKRLIE